MTSYWAIDVKHFNEATNSILIKQRTQPSLKTSDEIIFFEHKNMDVVFLSNASISTVKVEEANGGEISFSAVVADINRFEVPRTLSDFTFSLMKVYRFAEPFRHFVRQYVSLISEDFRTLVEARIFWARTAFGTYLNSLPQTAMAEFVQMISIEDPQVLVGKASFEKLWQYLHRHIEGEYVAAHLLSQAIAKDVARLSATVDGLNFEILRLDDDNGKMSDSLAEQHARLASFAESIVIFDEQDRNLLSQLDSRIQNNKASENAFEDLFRGTSWPTQMMRI